ncbi:MAG: hypothetical protein IKY35_00320 [Muribaculaceae bacterium]|nr:hypothetical protein [Muribaculaceae bacterium]
MACMPATFTSCKDYDDDIAVLTEQTGSLQSQVNTLEEALNANKEAAAQAAQAAADAMTAAKAAQATADEALAAAKAAQATGDEALALAKANEAAVAAAQADALNALAAAELAKEAAATAKAEAIAEVMEQVKALMDEQRALTEKELAEIAGKIEGIEKGLNELRGDLEGVNGELEDVKNEINVVADELATLEQAVEVQKAAFEEFQDLINGKIETIEANYADLLETVQGLESSVAALQAADEAIKGDIADVKASVQANATAIAEINTRIDEINTKLDALDKKIDDVKNQAFGYTDAEVAELKAELMGVIKEMDERLGGEISTLASNLANALNTLSTVFADRLTSITLMPDAYADGIPCIDFSTAIFKEMTGEGDNWKVGDAKEIRVTPNSIPVSYRLSPKSVNQNTIAEVAFVEKTASILTRGAEDDCILNVADFKVENGVLIVTATKNGDAAINKTQDGKINIAALRVSQKETKENGVTIAGAEVHSEYARVTEGVFTPTLAEVANPENHLYNTVNKAVANTYFAELPYDKTLKLDSVISVCKNFNGGHTIMSKQEIDSYKLSVEYALADFNATNAPQFGTWSKVENAVVTPGFYNEEGAFDAFNKKATGKQQVYRATLKHDGKVVDVKFVKVSIIPSESEALTIPLPSHSTAISCDADDYSFTISWRDFANVLNNQNIRLLNGTEFYNVYEQSKLQVSYLFGDKDLTEYVDVDFISDLDSSNSHAWGFKFNSQIPAEVFPLNVDDVTTLDIKVVCTPNTRYANQSYPVLTVTTSLIFDPLRHSLSMMAPQLENYWMEDKTTVRVLPLQYGSLEAGVTCDYRFPIQQAFLLKDTKSAVFNKALGCAQWDVIFSDAQSAGYAPLNRYELYYNNVLGAQLEWEAENDDHVAFDELCNVSDNHQVYATVFENPAGIEIIDANKPVQISFLARYPNMQVVPVESYNLQFVKPLNFSTAEFNGYFIDGALEGQNGYAINTADQFIIKDFRDNEVKKNNSDGLYNYYAIKPYVWHVDQARIGIMADGSIAPKDKVAYTIEEGREKGMVRANEQYTMLLSDVTNANLAVKVDGDNLIYVNEGGLPTEKEYYLVVPVTVEHKWGKAETAVVIPVKPGVVKNKARK